MAQRCLFMLLGLLLAGLVLALCSRRAEPVPSEPRTGPDSAPQARAIPWLRQPANPSAASSQGIRGTVIDERALPVAHAKVWLQPAELEELTSALSDPTSRAFVQGETDGDGRFAVAIECEQAFVTRELRIVAPGNLDAQEGKVKIVRGQWTDHGLVRLRPASAVEGRVTQANAPAVPIAGALVRVAARSASTLVPVTHDEADGACARTDADGRYRISSAPIGAVTITAGARGFAGSAKPGLELRHGVTTRCDFELGAGSNLRGRIVDSAGRGLGAVRVEATLAVDGTAPPIATWSHDDGRFEVPGMPLRPHRLGFAHPQYAGTQIEPVWPDSAPLAITLHRLGSVRISVTKATGWAIDEYEVRILDRLPGTGNEAMTAHGVRVIHTKNGEDGVLDGLAPPAQAYVLRIDAKGYPPAYSEPFRIELDQAPVLVTVRLEAGGELVGKVTDHKGAPLQGVRVGTSPFEMPDVPELASVVNRVASRATMAIAITDAQGAFCLRGLYPGKYYLAASHPEWSDRNVGPFPVRRDESTRVPDLVLSSGTLVAGFVQRTASMPELFAVGLARVPDAARQAALFRSALVGPDGKFAFQRRFPPGTYRVLVGRPTQPVPGSTLAVDHVAPSIELDARTPAYRLEIVVPAK